jgi:hypothetical protein
MQSPPRQSLLHSVVTNHESLSENPHELAPKSTGTTGKSLEKTGKLKMQVVENKQKKPIKPKNTP